MTQDIPYRGRFSTLDDLLSAVVFHRARPASADELKQVGCPELLRTLLLKCWDEDPSVRLHFANIVTENTIDSVIIELMIGDEDGRKLWHNNFPGQVWIMPIRKQVWDTI